MPPHVVGDAMEEDADPRAWTLDMMRMSADEQVVFSVGSGHSANVVALALTCASPARAFLVRRPPSSTFFGAAPLLTRTKEPFFSDMLSTPYGAPFGIAGGARRYAAAF